MKYMNIETRETEGEHSRLLQSQVLQPDKRYETDCTIWIRNEIRSRVSKSHLLRNGIGINLLTQGTGISARIEPAVGKYLSTPWQPRGDIAALGTLVGGTVGAISVTPTPCIPSEDGEIAVIVSTVQPLAVVQDFHEQGEFGHTRGTGVPWGSRLIRHFGDDRR